MKRLLLGVLLCASCNGSPATPAIDPDAIRKACAMEVSCLPSSVFTSGGGCVSEFEYGLATGMGIVFGGASAADIRRYIDCARTASGCTAALDCASRHHGPDWCAAHDKPSCDGDTLVECISEWGLIQTDCAALGMHCASVDGAAGCTDGLSCDPAAATRCDGNRAVWCDSSTKLEQRVDCGAVISGWSCRSVASGSGCLPPPSASCAQNGTTCDGPTGVICESGSVLRVECGQFASHCAVNGNGILACVPDASDCISSAHDTCVDNSLQMCVNGRWTLTPCSSIGLATCEATVDGAKCK